MKRIKIVDTYGMTWLSDPDEDGELAAHEEEVIELLTDFGAVNYIAIAVDGVKHYFNPANLVCAAIVDTAATPNPESEAR